MISHILQQATTIGSFEYKLLAIIDATAIGFTLYNKDFQVELINKKGAEHFSKIAGHELQLGEFVLDHLPDDRRREVAGMMLRTLHGERFEYDVEHNTSEQIILHNTMQPVSDKEGNIAGICVTTSDITEKKHLEQLAKRNAEMFQNAYTHSGIGIALVAPDGRWLNLNHAFCTLLGYTKEELLLSDFMAITHPNDLEKDLEYVAQMLRRERESYQMEKRYIQKNGEIVHVILTVSLVWNADGTPDFFISQVVDITADKALIYELEEKNIALQKTAAALATKNSQLQEIQHMISHDVRGPVRNIGSMMKMIEDGIFDFPTLAPMIQQSYANADEVITGLLDIAQLNADEKIPFEDCLLKNITEEMVESLKSGITDPIEVRYNFKVAVVFYPRRYLRSILYNLISNSIKYRSKDRACIIEISSAVHNTEVAIVVKDNGIGFDMNKHQTAVFKPGKVFHSGYDSKGIGLFITKNQVEKFGGTITVKSEVGKGTEFTIII